MCLLVGQGSIIGALLCTSNFLHPRHCRTFGFSQFQPWMSILVAPVEHVQLELNMHPNISFRVFLWFICPHGCMFCFLSRILCVPSGGQGNCHFGYPPPPCPSPPLVLPQGGGRGTVTCSTQNFSLQLTVLLWQNHHPRVLPKAFQWKVVSMCKSSKSSGAGPRKFTPSWSRRRSPYIGSPLNVSYAEIFRFMLQFLYLQMCVYGGSAGPQGGMGDCHLVTVPQGVVGDRLPWGGEGQGEGGVCSPG